MNNDNKKTKATVELADKLDSLEAEIKRADRDDKNYLRFLLDREDLIYGYDWSDEEQDELTDVGFICAPDVS